MKNQLINRINYYHKQQFWFNLVRFALNTALIRLRKRLYNIISPRK